MRFSRKSNWYILLGLCIGLLTLTFIILLVLYSISIFKHGSTIKLDDCAGQIFALFTALIALSLTISIAIPVFISRRQINDTINEYLDGEYRENIEYKVDEISTVDAHLARMVAFFLVEHKYYYWAIGWGFHALKSYQSLKDDHHQIYTEFHEMVICKIICESIRHKNEDITVSETSVFGNKDLQRIKLRAIKDFVDFEYQIYEKDKHSRCSAQIRNELTKDLSEIKAGMKEIFSDLLEDYPFKFSNMNESKRKNVLKDEVLKISRYRGSKKDYKKVLKVFNQIFMDDSDK